MNAADLMPHKYRRTAAGYVLQTVFPEPLYNQGGEVNPHLVAALEQTLDEAREALLQGDLLQGRLPGSSGIARTPQILPASGSSDGIAQTPQVPPGSRGVARTPRLAFRQSQLGPLEETAGDALTSRVPNNVNFAEQMQQMFPDSQSMVRKLTDALTEAQREQMLVHMQAQLNDQQRVSALNHLANTMLKKQEDGASAAKELAEATAQRAHQQTMDIVTRVIQHQDRQRAEAEEKRAQQAAEREASLRQAMAEQTAALARIGNSQEFGQQAVALLQQQLAAQQQAQTDLAREMRQAVEAATAGARGMDRDAAAAAAAAAAAETQTILQHAMRANQETQAQLVDSLNMMREMVEAGRQQSQQEMAVVAEGLRQDMQQAVDARLAAERELAEQQRRAAEEQRMLEQVELRRRQEEARAQAEQKAAEDDRKRQELLNERQGEPSGEATPKEEKKKNTRVDVRNINSAGTLPKQARNQRQGVSNDARKKRREADMEKLRVVGMPDVDSALMEDKKVDETQEALLNQGPSVLNQGPSDDNSMVDVEEVDGGGNKRKNDKTLENPHTKVARRATGASYYASGASTTPAFWVNH